MAASRRCIEGSSFMSSLRSHQRADRSLAHRLADREESALEDHRTGLLYVRRAYSWLLRPVCDVLVVALTAVGPRRCRENRCEAGALEELLPRRDHPCFTDRKSVG